MEDFMRSITHQGPKSQFINIDQSFIKQKIIYEGFFWLRILIQSKITNK